MLAWKIVTVISVNMEIADKPDCMSGTTAEFDLVAPFYPGLERLVFGTRLDDARQTFLSTILKANQVLSSGRREWPFLEIAKYAQVCGPD
jgi:hypothetical protein